MSKDDAGDTASWSHSFELNDSESLLLQEALMPLVFAAIMCLTVSFRYRWSKLLLYLEGGDAPSSLWAETRSFFSSALLWDVDLPKFDWWRTDVCRGHSSSAGKDRKHNLTLKLEFERDQNLVQGFPKWGAQMERNVAQHIVQCRKCLTRVEKVIG